MKISMKSDLSQIRRLEEEFKAAAIVAARFGAELTRQVQELLDANSVSLSFPIQYRVKTWASLTGKLKRKELALKSLNDLDDLVGLRLILQFKRDVSKVWRLIKQHFKVLKSYDSGGQLGTDQFGY
jgi:ppGpp synthetase/RelA/SpoT-type nucleotidyltranferase